MSGELKLHISLSLQNKIKTNKNAKDNHLFPVFKLCLRPYHNPHFSKILTKVNKTDKQQYNNNIKTRRVYN